MKILKILRSDIFLTVLAILAVFLLSTYTVREDEVAVVKRMGNITKIIVNGEDIGKVTNDMSEKGYRIEVTDARGLQIRIPIIDSVQKFSSKYLTYVSGVETVNTYDNKKIDIQIFTQYRVINPALVSMTLGDSVSVLNGLQDERVYPAILQTANMLNFNDFFDKNILNKALGEKTKIVSGELSSQYGIAIKDIGINRRTYPSSSVNSIQDRMIKDIQQDSEKIKAEGDAQYEEVISEAERMKQEIIANGTAEAAAIKAQADAEAISISKATMAKDLNLYNFLQKMNIYKNIKDTNVIMDKSNELFNSLSGY